MTRSGYKQVGLALLLAAVLLVVGAPGAQAHTTIIEPPEPHNPYQWWVDQATVPTPTTSISVIEESCPNPPPWAEPNLAACTAPWDSRIWFGWMPGWARRETFYHELGHNFSFAMPGWAKSRYLAILGRPPSTPWEIGGSNSSPIELFAQSYALCAFRVWIPKGGDVREQEPVGGREVHNRTCRLILRVGKALGYY